MLPITGVHNSSTCIFPEGAGRGQSLFTEMPSHIHANTRIEPSCGACEVSEIKGNRDDSRFPVGPIILTELRTALSEPEERRRGGRGVCVRTGRYRAGKVRVRPSHIGGALENEGPGP